MAETNPAPPTAPAPRSPLWMRVLLVVSLGLNLLVIGMVGGAVLSGGGPGAPRDSLRDLAANPFVAALEPDDRRALLRDLFSDREALREGRANLRARFESLLDTLRADELDIAALEALVAEQRAAGETRQRLVEGAFVARVADMTAAERRAYADRLEASVRRQRRR